MKHRLIRALLCQDVDRTPLWIMRQAGRYLPEYQQIRKENKDFLTLCKTPELAAKITLQPIERFELDAAIIFSDILTIPDAYGLGLYFEEGEGPRFKKPIQSSADILALPKIDPEQDLGYVMNAIRLTHKMLNHSLPIIGFSGSPWTLAVYMVEGGTSKHFQKIKRLRYQDPLALHQLLAHLAESVSDYLNAQIRAGASAVMLFDSWAGVLSQPDYLEFSLFYIKKIIEKLIRKKDQSEIPIIVFSKNGGQQLVEIAKAGCNAIGLDWTANVTSAKTLLREALGKSHKIALQGNLDPGILYSSTSNIEIAVKKLLDEMQDCPGFVMNLGHGIPADAPIEGVQALVKALHQYGKH